MYGELKRAIHLDFHTMPGIYNFNETWDAAKFAERLDKAHVKYINAFARCNLGFAYYDTKIGIPYPGMKGDMLGDLIKECHKRDIGVTAYLNIGIDHESCRLHRDWCKLGKDGRVLWDSNSRVNHSFRLPCFETGYGDYTYGMIKELIELHPEVDGIFLDCINMVPCYGNECLEAIKAEGGNHMDDKTVEEYTVKSVMKFCKRIKELIGDRNLICNSQPYWLMRENNTHIEVECLPSGGWGYDYVTPQAAFARNIKDKVLYMSGRFQASWGDFGGLKSKPSLEYDMWDAVMNAMECSIGDHMHPAEILDETVYNVIGEIYGDMMAMEPWTDGAKYQADIGICVPRESGFFFGGPIGGLTRILNELKYTYDIVNETMDFAKYKMLIIPDYVRLIDALRDKVAAHIAAGKPVLSAGAGGLAEGELKFALPDWKLTVEGMDTETTAYYTFKDDKFRYSTYSKGILMKANEDAEVLGEHIQTYFKREWDGFHGNMYFPPDKKTGYQAVVMMGNICHISFDIFTAYYDMAYVAHKELVSYCIKQLFDNPLFTCEGLPSTARVTVTETDKHKLVHVKVTYPEHRGKLDIIEEHNVLPAGAKITIDGGYKSAKIIPCGTDVLTCCKDGKTEITLPQIVGYVCAALEK